MDLGQAVLSARQRRPLRWASLWIAVTVSVLVSSAAVCGLPYWRDHAWAAVATVCCCGGLGVAGVLMQTEGRTRRCGAMLVITGIAWSVTWSQSWNTGPLPMISQFTQSICYLAFMVAILQYIRPEGLGKLERWWVASGVVVLLIGVAVWVLISRPTWLGYQANVFWPHFNVSHGHFNWYVYIYSKLFIVLTVGYGLVLFRQASMNLPRKYRRLNRPLLLLITAGIFAVTWTEQGPALTNLNLQLEVFSFQSLIGVFFVLALFYTGMVDRFICLRVRDQLMARANPPTMRGFRDAVAKVLDDPSLQIYYRIPESNGYTDSQGEWAGSFDGDDWAGDRGDRWLCQVFTDVDALAAIIDLDPRLGGRRSLISGVKSVAGLLLMHSDLREEIRAAGERLQRQFGVLRAGITERQRLERDLHDGPQQMLIALSMKMGAAAAVISEPEMQDLVAGWRKDLREATDELRNLARGIYPAALSEHGIRSAFESLAERQTEMRVDLEVPGTRFPPLIETSLYFAVAEALTNAAKHAQASRVRIRVEHKPPNLTCVVADDGIGTATRRPGGGLEGMVNRIRMLGGDVRIKADFAEGSTIEMVLPCE